MSKNGRRKIKFGNTEAGVVRLVGRMPFVASGEVTDLLGLDDAQGSLKVMRKLEGLGYVTSLKTAENERYGHKVPSYCLTERGIGCLAELDGIDVDDVYERYPVSLQWRRALLRRMEALEVFYRLCRVAAVVRRKGAITFDEGEEEGEEGDPGEYAVGQPSEETLFWCGRTEWLDGTIVFGEGQGAREVRVLRIGPTRTRRATLHHLGSMMESWRKRGVERVVIVVPGYVELMHVEQWLRSNATFIQAFCLVERELKDVVDWRDLMFSRPDKYGSDHFPLWETFSGLCGRRSGEGDELDGFEPHAKAIMPPDTILTSGRSDRAILVGASLNRRERICLQAVADWPLALRGHLLGLKDVSERAFKSLFDMGLICYAWDDRRARVLLSEEGMRYVANRDRSSLTELKKKWAYVLLGKREPELKNLRSFPVTGKGLDPGQRVRAEGGKLRAVSRQLAHLDGTTEFFCALGKGTQGFDVVEVLPTHRGERWAKIGRRMRAILPMGRLLRRRGMVSSPMPSSSSDGRWIIGRRWRSVFSRTRTTTMRFGALGTTARRRSPLCLSLRPSYMRPGLRPCVCPVATSAVLRGGGGFRSTSLR